MYYVIQQRIVRLKQRFKAFVLFEELRFPRMSILASKANTNEDLWSSVMRLLNSFFAGDKTIDDSWIKLEFKLSNPNLLLFTASPEHQAKDICEWIQYILHQRKESAMFVK